MSYSVASLATSASLLSGLVGRPSCNKILVFRAKDHCVLQCMQTRPFIREEDCMIVLDHFKTSA